MKLDEIQTMWVSDSQIDRTELGEESLKIPQLHSKYYNLFSAERMALRKMEQEYKELYRIKFEYYNGTISEEDLNLFRIVDTAEEAIDHLNKFYAKYSLKPNF